MKLSASILVLSCLTVAHCEVFTALVEMEELLDTEAVLMRTLSNYIDVQEKRVDTLKRKAAEYAREHEEASADISKYLNNPINAYLLVKRLTSDWRDVEKLMVDDVGQEFTDRLTGYRETLKFPSDEDLNGAAVALMRLQDTYHLNTASVARGELNGVQYSTEMSAGDCFELGRQSYNNGDYYHTTLWMNEALDRLSEETNKTTTREDILEYLAFSTYMEGNVRAALRLTDELLEIVPSHQRAQGNKVYYQQALSATPAKQRKGEDGSDDENVDKQYAFTEKASSKQKRSSDDVLPEREMYEALCRGEGEVPPAKIAKLKCRYTTRNNPYFILSPIKEEEAYHKPNIWILHDVMNDAEIATIKKLAQPRFKRATVQNYKTGELETANYRISKSAWLKGEEHPHVEAVNQRVEAITGLTVTTAEELQVVNYGIGGHYEPHFDFARKEETNAFKSLGTGNRIATVLFYMSDVAQGGATVFPHLNVALWPTKGSAAFWYNLHANGEGDYMTRHAACPVLAGSKWVSNKWIHERGQEFRKPCDLTYDS
ncbi:prolyl 4-hydroxylase subunit alpha-1 [Neocloeon triangulifer]|uniref:prolyl 4-hydroxylase subunit alpha-1 n=1 Tax=Neocloeon triangulifer TaxID=2078957 RepID=UPI00286F4969|nr:prolyl 4-hydroxylase subunit alpha-1 [Neocloeon triangulifer]